MLSLRLVRRYRWAANASTIIWIIFGCAIASNIGLIPKDAPIYSAIIDFTVPFAVCIILFTVSLADVKKAGRPMIAAFVLASIGTMLGVLLASLSMDPLLSRILAEEAWKLAGPYTGTFIGGSLNFFALWEGLEVGNQDLLAAANAVDNLSLFPLYALWMFLPSILIGRYAVSKMWQVELGEQAAELKEKPRLVPVDIATLAFLAVLVMAVSNWMKDALIDPFFPELPSILIVTTLALILGQFPAVRRLKGAWEMGDLSFNLFFAAVGATISFYQAIVLSPALFLYVMIIMVVHMAVVYGGGRLMRMDAAVLTIASVATKGGPPLIVPVCQAKDWRHLVLPGIIIGVLGYAVGNYAGYAVAQAVRVFVA